MLKNFTIKNYKSIKELVIEKFNRINLFIGRNNAGKSNILEAILLYATRFNLNSIILINDQRIERAVSPRLIDRGSLTTLCLPLAPHRSILSLRKGIELKSSKDSVLLQQVKVIPMMREDRLFYNYRSFRDDEWGGRGVPRVGIPTKGEMQYLKLTYETSVSMPCIYVNCANKQISKWSEYWENLVLANEKGSVIKALQIVDPKIEDVDIIVHETNNQLIPYVKVEGKYLPLFSMGDGLVHIFNIMLALVNARGGVLLLDEMENGLHIRTLEKLWEVVNDLSKQWNIQVFVTTHSNDCIKAFSEKSREEGTLYMINHKKGETSYNTKEFRVVEKMLADDVDLRNFTDDENNEKEK